MYISPRCHKFPRVNPWSLLFITFVTLHRHYFRLHHKWHIVHDRRCGILFLWLGFHHFGVFYEEFGYFLRHSIEVKTYWLKEKKKLITINTGLRRRLHLVQYSSSKTLFCVPSFVKKALRELPDDTIGSLHDVLTQCNNNTLITPYSNPGIILLKFRTKVSYLG